MNSLKKIIDTAISTKNIGIIVFILTAIIMTMVLSSRYYFHQSLIENNISKRDVYANKTIKIVDVEKTQKLKNEIVKKILPILVPIQDDFISNNLLKNYAKLDMVRASEINLEAKKAELMSYFNVLQDNTPVVIQLEYLLKVSDSHLDNLQSISEKTLNKILENGVEESDVPDKILSIIKTNMTQSVSRADYDAISFMLKSVIVPNIITDEEATEMSKKNALNSVKPVEVTYKAGSKIVSAGQIVSRLQKDALKQCGYNIIQLNVSGVVGIFILVLIALCTCAYYIETNEPLFKRKAYYALVSCLMIFISLISSFLPSYDYYIFFLPIATFSILLAIFLNPKTSLITSLSIFATIALVLQLELLITVVFTFGIFATVFAIGTVDYTRRMDLIRVGLISSFVYAIVLTGAFFLDYNLDELNFTTYGRYLIAVLANGLISSIIALGLLPIIESIFKIFTPYGLMELANSNHPLLQKLQEKAPGTHHHSQMVAILAEAAAESIGANPTLTRIGALYHDVGKINRPLFFIENQSYYGIDNPHEQFSPKFSKMVITTHPKDGVEIAKEYNILPSIYPFILEHHGDSIASYFYNEAIKQDGKENVSEEEYRYNAPRPSTKESAIVMLADSVESAVRSLKSPSFEEIDQKVNAVINGKLIDNQLSDSPLTLKDIKIIIATFNRVLKGMHHQRIKYHEDIKNIKENINEEQNDAN